MGILHIFSIFQRMLSQSGSFGDGAVIASFFVEVSAAVAAVSKVVVVGV